MKNTMNKNGIFPENGRILIVDDEEIVHQTLKRLLISEGYTINSAYGGTEALDRLDSGYDLVICDIRMPEMDGIEVMKEIRKRELDVEVLMLTGYASLESATRVMNYGAHGYNMKPIENITEFKNKIREAVYTAQTTSKNEEFYKAVLAANIIYKKCDIVVIDNIGVFTLKTKLDNFRGQFDALNYTMSQRGYTTIYIMVETSYNRTESIAAYSVHGLIKMSRKENPYTNKHERNLEVTKMRNTQIPDEPIRFEIVPKKGIMFIT